MLMPSTGMNASVLRLNAMLVAASSFPAEQADEHDECGEPGDVDEQVVAAGQSISHESLEEPQIGLQDFKK